MLHLQVKLRLQLLLLARDSLLHLRKQNSTFLDHLLFKKQFFLMQLLALLHDCSQVLALSSLASARLRAL